MELRRRVFNELTQNILPFWLKLIDHENGGFYGEADPAGLPDPLAPKGGILNSRILWTFSHAYRLFKEEAYLQAATQAYTFLIEHFWDPDFGGTYWLVDHRGMVIDPKKQIYAQGFSLYGLSEYYLATQNYEALQKSIQMFELVEAHAFDSVHGGYYEAFNRDWSLAQDFRLSDKEQNDPKSMNTHLHILEPYTNLLRAWDNPRLRNQQKKLIKTFIDHIIDPDTHHFRLFFSEAWLPRTCAISYGHDIEGSWLLAEASEVLGDADLENKVEKVALDMAKAVLMEAVDENGGMLYEYDPEGETIEESEWWTLAEAVVGFYNAFQLSGDETYSQAAIRAWQFIEDNLVDKVHGEWYRSVTRQGEQIPSKLVDFWKCPYHNGRACMEIWQRTHEN